jgi:hypothetical protein
MINIDEVKRNTMYFLGKPVDYWIDLKAKADSLDDKNIVEDLLKEVRELRGKVSFYESRIQQMAGLMNK